MQRLIHVEDTKVSLLECLSRNDGQAESDILGHLYGEAMQALSIASGRLVFLDSQRTFACSLSHPGGQDRLNCPVGGNAAWCG